MHYNPKDFDFGKKKAFPMRPQHFFTSIDKVSPCQIQKPAPCRAPRPAWGAWCGALHGLLPYATEG